MNLSYWERQTFFTDIDIAIIGSGIVGLCTAIELKNKFPSKRIVIFERSFLPSGASTKNAGFACFGSISEIAKNLGQFTENEVLSLISKRWKGLNKLRKLLDDTEIGYENIGGYEIFSDEKEFQKCAEYLPILNERLKTIIGENVYEIADGEIDKFELGNVKHLIFNRFEGVVNTGKMMKSLIEKARNLGVEIFNGIEISGILQKENFVEISLSSDFYFAVNQAVVTTNAFSNQLLPHLNIIPGRGQVIVTKPIENLKIKGAFHLDSGYFYFRNINNRILLGGGRNLDFKAEETTEFGSTKIVQNELKRLLEEVILPNKNFEIDYTWSGIMAFGDTQMPIVKAVSRNLFCAVKCQGMGVALGALVAEEVVEIMENAN